MQDCVQGAVRREMPVHKRLRQRKSDLRLVCNPLNVALPQKRTLSPVPPLTLSSQPGAAAAAAIATTTTTTSSVAVRTDEVTRSASVATSVTQPIVSQHVSEASEQESSVQGGTADDFHKAVNKKYSRISDQLKFKKNQLKFKKKRKKLKLKKQKEKMKDSMSKRKRRSRDGSRDAVQYMFPVGTKVRKYLESQGLWSLGCVVKTCSGQYHIVYEADEEPHIETKAEIVHHISLAKVAIGSRISIYWEDDGCYYDATVAGFKETRRRCFKLLYDDGEREWIDLNKNKFRLLDAVSDQLDRSQKDTENDNSTIAKHSILDRPQLSERSLSSEIVHFIGVGDRVAVYWEGEKKYFNGTVVDERQSSMHKRLKVQYDDGDIEWINPRREGIKLLSTGNSSAEKQQRASEAAEIINSSGDEEEEHEVINDTSERSPSNTNNILLDSAVRAKVGWKLSIYCSDSKMDCTASITHLQRGRKPHGVTFDEDGRFEWMDLKRQQFKLLDTKKPLDPARYPF